MQDGNGSYVTKGKDITYHNGKIAAARFFALNILSTVKARCEAIKVGDRTPIEMAEELFTI